MKLPGLDGQYFYRVLAEAGGALSAKFLFVTGDVLGITTQEFLRSHHLPHIAKPFRLEEFAGKIAFILRQEPATSPQPRRTSDFSLKKSPQPWIINANPRTNRTSHQ